MSEPEVSCNICGRRLVSARMSAELYLAKPDEKQIGPRAHQRMFEGECPEHGHRIVASPSEGHSTILASRLEKIFNKGEQSALRAHLARQERHDFQAALGGQYAWEESDVERWKAILRNLVPSAVIDKRT